MCTHPAVKTKEQVESVKTLENGAIVAGGLTDIYATFCKAVDLHLTSLGEPSRLIIDAAVHDVEPPLLDSGN